MTNQNGSGGSTSAGPLARSGHALITHFDIYGIATPRYRYEVAPKGSKTVIGE